MGESLEDMLAMGVCTVQKAGQLIREIREQRVQSTSKTNGSLVTDGDLASDKLIVESIAASFPNHKIHSEEGGWLNPDSQSRYTWVLDSLDGTASYVNHEHSVSISLALLRDNEPVLAIVYNPFTDELFSAVEKQVSKLNKTELPLVERSSPGTLNYSISRRKVEDINALLDPVWSEGYVKRIVSTRGSPSFSLAQVAKGSHSHFILDCYREARPEDYSAGTLLVRNVGGKVTNLSGTDINPLTHRGYLIASVNPSLHDLLLEELEASGFGDERTTGKIVYVGGLYGTGKSTLAQKIESGLGYKRFNADITRRELGMTSYKVDDSDIVWGQIFFQASKLLQERRGVIIESTYLNETQRTPDFNLSRAHHADGLMIEVICPEEIAKARISARSVTPDGLHVPTNRVKHYNEIKDQWTPVIPQLRNTRYSDVSYVIYDSHSNTLHKGLIKRKHEQWMAEIADTLGLSLLPVNSAQVHARKRYNIRM